MTLKALIIRADGVLADTGEMERGALNRTIADAGFSWQCDRPVFAAMQGAASAFDGLVTFVMPRLGYQRSSEDARHLATAMVRRKTSIFCEMLDHSPPAIRAGVRDLIKAARAEGLRLALVTSLPESATQAFLEAALGSRAAQAFDIIASPNSCKVQREGVGGAGNQPAGSEVPLQAVYEDALARLGLRAEDCLALDANAAGLAAAAAAGLPVLIVRSATAGDSPFEGAAFAADDVPALVGHTRNARLDPLTQSERGDLIAVLQRIHAGTNGPEATSDRSSVVLKVANILQTKGSSVKTILADESVRDLSQRLADEEVGAMVVVSKSGRLAGIISERDVARGLSQHGAALSALTVSQLMTKGVVTCGPDDTIANISKIMTQRRIRHLPVLEGDELVGLVSIGDVIKYRLDEMQLEANVLRDYALAKR